jgi:hypothetical protein
MLTRPSRRLAAFSRYSLLRGNTSTVARCSLQLGEKSATPAAIRVLGNTSCYHDSISLPIPPQ